MAKDEVKNGRDDDIYEVIFTHRSEKNLAVIGPTQVTAKNRHVAIVKATINKFDALKSVDLLTLKVKVRPFE